MSVRAAMEYGVVNGLPPLHPYRIVASPRIGGMVGRSLDTKRLFASTLKRLLQTQPLDHITVTEIAQGCGVNRQTFYYHFHDIYDLVSWIYLNEADAALGEERTHDTWQHGMLAILQYLKDNRDFVVKTIHSIDASYTQRYLREQTDRLLADVVAEEAQGRHVSMRDQAFIARFYSSGFVGLVLDWIDDGMREDPERLVARLDLVIHGDLASAISRMSQPQPQGRCSGRSM